MTQHYTLGAQGRLAQYGLRALARAARAGYRNPGAAGRTVQGLSAKTIAKKGKPFQALAAALGLAARHGTAFVRAKTDLYTAMSPETQAYAEVKYGRFGDAVRRLMGRSHRVISRAARAAGSEPIHKSLRRNAERQIKGCIKIGASRQKLPPNRRDRSFTFPLTDPAFERRTTLVLRRMANMGLHSARRSG